MSEGTNKKRTTQSAVWKIVMWFSIIGCLACLGFLGWYFWSTYQAEKEYQELQAAMQAQAEAEAAEREALASSYTLEEIQSAEFTGIIEEDVPAPEIPEGVIRDAEENPINFTELTKINTELYAWIRIPNTNIDYPIAQHQGNDQTYYLHRDMNQNPRYSGCIYSEKANSMDFSDPVTVLYGHNMKNGSMFQNLHKFKNETFFEENKYVYIYTGDKTFVYEIFAAYPYDNRHLLNSFDFSDVEIYKEYLIDCMNPRSMEAQVRDGMELTEDSRILTLSTCIGGQPDKRFLVQAVLMYEEDL